jgi:FMN phosphatase YigB (HAD superfamily)
MTPRITAVLFDLGDTLWHFPSMPPVEVIRSETVKRVSNLLRRWGKEVTDQRFLLARDIRMEMEVETSRAFRGDSIDPGYPDICRRVAARHGLKLTAEQGEELWEDWNLLEPGRAVSGADAVLGFPGDVAVVEGAGLSPGLRD